MAGKDAPLGKDAFLSFAGKLAEELVDLEGMGKVLCRELTGSGRALVLDVLAPAVNGGTADLGRYQQLLLQHGLVDPESPVEARKPLLDMAGALKAMELGASKIEHLCGTVERLSGLDKSGRERAEKNSGPTPSSSATSG